MASEGSDVRLPDSAARITALKDHSRSLLVEAGAGSGKTALMAGRVALMIGAGVPPGEIVAITFTEAAAAELLERIETLVRELLTGSVPLELAAALPSGLTEAQKGHLRSGSNDLDEITCTTIHGFCQQLIRPYAVETGLDPGAAVIDPAAAELAYQDLLEAWLSTRFGRDRGEGLGRIPPIPDAGGTGDFLTPLVLAAPDLTLALIRQTTRFLKEYRTADASKADFEPEIFERFVEAVRNFASWYRDCGVRESETAKTIEDLQRVAELLQNAPTQSLSNKWLTDLLFHSPPSACRQSAPYFKLWRLKTKWKNAAASAGGSVALGEQLSAAGKKHYDACDDAYSEFRYHVGALSFFRFVREFDPFRTLFGNYKRNAALLDFDDLLHQARDLLSDNEQVRAALAIRYPRILVDEFQDTDPLQSEIIWRLTGEGDPDTPWHERAIRPGALFVVGDPKQAIYRFRGADVNTYLLAKKALERSDPSSILEITANFRTRKPILEYVNTHFVHMLDESQNQPGFTRLEATRSGGDGPCVAALDVHLENEDMSKRGKPLVPRVRWKEAEAVASAVVDLIGAYPVWDKNRKTLRPARPGDIALLAPTGTSLWIYERAMEKLEIPIATQAGKGFFRRQEVQDLIAIARVIADSRDTLALGALIRGPLVGLTEEEIADEIESLHVQAESSDSITGDGRGRGGRLRLWSDPNSIGNATLRRTLEVLQNLARKSGRLTPYHLLMEAVEELHVNSILKARHPQGAERALANVELVLEMARPYAGRGIGDFARALWQSWNEQDTQAEGRPDAFADSVSIITMHSAKGLEWPIVFPINSTTKPRRVTGILYGRQDDTIHIKTSYLSSRRYDEIREEEEMELFAERVRLWYVALTRARDLLVLPRQEQRIEGDWLSLIDIDIRSLPSLFAGGGFRGTPVSGGASSVNAQDIDTWKREASIIRAHTRSISWHRPARHEDPPGTDLEQETVFAGTAALLDAAPEEDQAKQVQGGPARGLILHKLMEEILTGELTEDENSLQSRAAELIAQLSLEDCVDASMGPSSTEMASTAARTLTLPEVAPLLSRLAPEFPVYAHAIEGSAATLTAGIADAVSVDEKGRIDVVVDWKSDVNPGRKQTAMYHQQVRDYLRSTTAQAGLIVFMSSGRVDRIVRRG